MDLRARLFPLGDKSEGLLAKYLPQAVYESARCPVSVSDPVLSDIIRDGDEADGFWVSGELVLSREKRQQLTRFQPVARYALKETDRDYESNSKVADAAPPIDAGASEPIHLPRGFALSRISMKPNMVGVIGQWTSEYVVGAAVAQALKEEGFSGFELLPVLVTKSGTPYDGFFQLFSEVVLPPAVLDSSVERISSRFAEEDGRLRHLGCLGYSSTDLADRPDFARTAEPWATWSSPFWIVSAVVEALFKRLRFRGWHFRPILVTGTELYDTYEATWAKLRKLVAKASKSSFDGGIW